MHVIVKSDSSFPKGVHCEGAQWCVLDAVVLPMQDILTVITYSTPSVRCKALDLLLHYWPIPIQEFQPHSHKLTYGGEKIHVNFSHTIITLCTLCLCLQNGQYLIVKIQLVVIAIT